MDAEYCQVVERDIHDVPVPNYSEEEHGTWKLLISNQREKLPGRACQEYLDGLKAVEFPTEKIPRLADISDRVKEHTGWQLIRVDGLVHPRDFFKLLKRNIFPSTDFIRKRSELMYTPEPDMFHDLFGHVPLLSNPDFTEFFECFGQAGEKAFSLYPEEEHPMHLMLTRLYWFTVEFGLVQTPKGVRAYGAGSVSSPAEIEFCMSDKCKKMPFEADAVAARDYDISVLQDHVFVIDSFASLGESFRDWARSHKLL